MKSHLFLLTTTLMLVAQPVLPIANAAPRTDKKSQAPVPVIQEGHAWDGSEPQFAISPDGRFVVSSSSTRLKLWNGRGELLRDLEKPSVWGYGTPIFSLDGKRLLVVAQDRTAFYTLPSGEKVREVVGASFSNDARFVIRGTQNAIRFSDARTGKRLGTIMLHSSEPCGQYLNFSPNGRLVALGCADGKMRLWDMRNGRLVRVLSDPRGGFGGSSGVIGPAAWSPDGSTLVTGGEDPNWQIPDDNGPNTEAKYFHAYALKVWDVKTGRLLRVWPGYGSNMYGVLLDSFVSSREVLIGSKVVDIWSGKVTRQLRDKGTLSRDGKLQVVYTDNRLGTFELRETWTGKVLARFPGRGLAGFEHIAWSPDGALLVAAENIGTPVRVFDAHSGALKFSLPTSGEAILALRWLQDCTLAGMTLQSAWIWDRNGKLVRQWRPPSHREYNESAGVSPDGKLFVSQSNPRENQPLGLLRVWDSSGKLLRDIPDFAPQNASWYAFTLVWMDGARVARGTGATVEILNLINGTREIILQAPDSLKNMFAVAASPDGSWLLCSGEEKSTSDVLNYQLLLWDMRDGQLKRVYQNARPAVQWNSDSKTFVATGGNSSHLVEALFSLDSSTPRATLLGPLTGWNTQTAFSPDFHFLAAPSNDYTATTTSIWNARSGKVAVTLHLFMTPRKTAEGYTDKNAPVSWLALTHDGFYDGAPGIEKWLRWRSRSTLLPVGALQKKRRRPEKIRAALAR